MEWPHKISKLKRGHNPVEVLTMPKEMCTFPNSEDKDEMPYKASFYQDLNCLLRQNQSSEREIQTFF